MQRSSRKIIALIIFISQIIDCCSGKCQRGYYYGVDSNQCTLLLAHTYSTSWYCKKCPNNSMTFWEFRDVDGRQQSDMDEVCVCGRFYYAEDKKSTCPLYTNYWGNADGYPPFAEEFTCKPCPYGHYCPGGAMIQDFCVDTQTYCYKPVYHQTPVKCPYQYQIAGIYATRDEACTCPDNSVLASWEGTHRCECLPGFFWNTKKYTDNTKLVCIPCLQNMYCPGGMNATACPKGYATNVTGAQRLAECNICDPKCLSGTQYCTQPSERFGMEACLSCPVMGTYCSEENSGKVGWPKFCQAGTYRNADTKGTMCNSCKEGKYSQLEGATSCLECSPGYYQGIEGQTSCSPCEPGKYQPSAGQPACSPCASGTYNPYYASSEKGCLSCPPGILLSTSLSIHSLSRR